MPARGAHVPQGLAAGSRRRPRQRRGERRDYKRRCMAWVAVSARSVRGRERRSTSGHGGVVGGPGHECCRVRTVRELHRRRAPRVIATSGLGPSVPTDTARTGRNCLHVNAFRHLWTRALLGPSIPGLAFFARIFVCLFGGLSLPNRRGSGLWGKVIGVGVRFDGHGYPLLCRRSGPGRTQGTNSTWTLSRRRRPSARLCAAAIHAVLDRPLRHSRFSPIPRQHLGLVTVHRFETDFGDRAL
ncbi:MAG: hypothetical protein QOD02_400 [Mycobacterium sp.]|jgi:hypothetical protein|nr:hypothetical protein [Mycobacterium sp.]